jgi:hypothetical protein
MQRAKQFEEAQKAAALQKEEERAAKDAAFNEARALSKKNKAASAADAEKESAKKVAQSSKFKERAAAFQPKENVLSAKDQVMKQKGGKILAKELDIVLGANAGKNPMALEMQLRAAKSPIKRNSLEVNYESVGTSPAPESSGGQHSYEYKSSGRPAMIKMAQELASLVVSGDGKVSESDKERESFLRESLASFEAEEAEIAEKEEKALKPAARKSSAAKNKGQWEALAEPLDYGTVEEEE